MEQPAIAVSPSGKAKQPSISEETNKKNKIQLSWMINTGSNNNIKIIINASLQFHWLLVPTAAETKVEGCDLRCLFAIEATSDNSSQQPF